MSLPLFTQDSIRRRRARYDRLDARLKAAHERDAHRLVHLTRQMQSLESRTGSERDALVAAHAEASARIAKLRRALDQVQSRRLKLMQAWVLLRFRECFERTRPSYAPPVHCIACGVQLGPDAWNPRFCSDQCEHRWERTQFAGAHGHCCAHCQRYFDSTAVMVPVFDADAVDPQTSPEARIVAICSMACWAACSVDEDEPPEFPGPDILVRQN